MKAATQSPLEDTIHRFVLVLGGSSLCRMNMLHESIKHHLRAYEAAKIGIICDPSIRNTTSWAQSVSSFSSSISTVHVSTDSELAARIKGRRFSMLCIPDLSEFASRKVLYLASAQLRLHSLPDCAHKWIGSVSAELAPLWVFRAFFGERLRMDPKYPLFQKRLSVVECHE